MTEDDGEAMSIALAASRHLELVIADKQAANHTRRAFSEIRLWSAPEILKLWADSSAGARPVLQKAVRQIEARALAGWWHEFRGDA